jgi:hypothetical protein
VADRSDPRAVQIEGANRAHDPGAQHRIIAGVGPAQRALRIGLWIAQGDPFRFQIVVAGGGAVDEIRIARHVDDGREVARQHPHGVQGRHHGPGIDRHEALRARMEAIDIVGGRRVRVEQDAGLRLPIEVLAA